MHSPSTNEGVFFQYEKEEDLFYKEIYGGRPHDRSYVRLYNKGKFETKAYVYADSEMDEREYILLNFEVKYLDTIKTLMQVDRLLKKVCEDFNVTMDDMRHGGAKQEFIEPKHLLFYILREEYEMTLTHIASMFNVVSHASVFLANKKIKGYMEVGHRYKKKVESYIVTVMDEPSELQVN